MVATAKDSSLSTAVLGRLKRWGPGVVFVPRDLLGLAPSCSPAIGFVGSPTQGGSTSFHITGSGFLNKKLGLLFYGLAANDVPFQGGTLCVGSTLKRTPIQNSAGSPTGSDCTGTYDFDFEAFLLGGSNPALVAGLMLYTQYWSRDPFDSQGFGSSFSNGLSFQICP